MGRILLLTGRGATAAYGAVVARGLAGTTDVARETVGAASHVEVARLLDVANSAGTTLVIGIGGGRVLDVAKSLAYLCAADLALVPTAISHDGVSSPVASLIDGAGRRVSVGAATPAAVIVDTDVVRSAPPQTLRAGLGDVLSNLSAIEDWRLADARNADVFDGYSALLADSAARSLLMIGDLTQDAGIELLARSVVMSGVAMVAAGTSRPCSGAEHLISHSLDERLGSRARLHGEQVALGTLVSFGARGGQPTGLRETFAGSGLPLSPGDLDLPIDLLIEAIMKAPSTRPERYTVLDEIDLSWRAVGELVERTFS
jgi:glycerol-1-phosphate dehydrogenase [NAD(P)+]